MWLNLNVLDQFVCEHFVLQRKKENKDSEDELYITRYRETKESLHEKVAANIALEQIISCVLQARTGEAYQVLSEWESKLLQDTRLTFHLLLMQLADKIEQHDVGAALRFCQEQLAPKALDAYLEAYDDFKRALRFFVLPSSIPVERQHLASKLFATFQSLKSSTDSWFYICLKYLLNIVCSEITSATRIREEAYQAVALLVPGLSQRPLPIEGYREFPESDIQTLKEALVSRISRDDAILALKYADGDLTKALKNELSLIQCDNDLMSSLIDDYIETRCLRREISQVELVNLLDDDTKDLPSWRILIQAIRFAAGQGDVISILRLLRKYRSEVLDKYPKLHFRLLQMQFYYSLVENNLSSALDILRSDMSVATQKYPQLFPWLKESATILFLFHLEGTQINRKKRQWNRYFEEQFSLPLFASSICTVLMESFCVYEPQLVKNLRFYLYVHKEWCAKNHLEDPFLESLGIQALSTKDSLLDQIVDEEDYILNKNESLVSATADSGDSSRCQSTEEQVIFTLMEFLAVSRAEAIALFNQYTGSSKDPAYILNTLLSEL
eukprot:jgi/Galph1/3229/GphlegSOOS_G1917.1